MATTECPCLFCQEPTLVDEEGKIHFPIRLRAYHDVRGSVLAVLKGFNNGRPTWMLWFDASNWTYCDFRPGGAIKACGKTQAHLVTDSGGKPLDWHLNYVDASGERRVFPLREVPAKAFAQLPKMTTYAWNSMNTPVGVCRAAMDVGSSKRQASSPPPSERRPTRARKQVKHEREETPPLVTAMPAPSRTARAPTVASSVRSQNVASSSQRQTIAEIRRAAAEERAKDEAELNWRPSDDARTWTQSNVYEYSRLNRDAPIECVAIRRPRCAPYPRQHLLEFDVVLRHPVTGQEITIVFHEVLLNHVYRAKFEQLMASDPTFVDTVDRCHAICKTRQS